MMTRTPDQAVPETIDLTEQNFDEVLATSQGLVMVDFWAAWCGPCRAIAPVLEQVVDASEGRVTLRKVNVDENPGLAARHGIRSIPTILFVKQGRIVDRLVGAVPLAALQRMVDADA
jgi:thioredoxin 1